VLPRPKATPHVLLLQASLKQLGWRLHRKLPAAAGAPQGQSTQKSRGGKS
jgi:hypothetical protein